MKKNIIIFLSLFFISLATAIPSLTFQHEETQVGETILATITTTGEFTKQIQPSDVTFYEGRKQVFFESDITFYKGTHYLYIYSTRQGNFSIQIAEILFKEADGIKSTTITKLFNITNETAEILSIKPGFVFTFETPTIKLYNKGNATLDFTYNEIELSLESSEAKEISLTPEQTFSYFNISSYKEFSIPIIYLATNTTFESPLVQSGLRINPESLLVELFTDNKTEKTLQLFNFDEDITDIQAASSLSFVKIEKPKNMESREIQNLTITFNAETPGHFQGHINITYTQNSEENILSIPLSLFILPKGSDEKNFELSEQSCEEIYGTVCDAKEVCDGEATFTKNKEYCCLGTCKSTIKDKVETSFGWLIALIIFAALGGSGYYLYKKQKKIVPKKPEEQLKESSEKFDKRMKEIPKTKRTTGRIARS